jgi:hypothetical protein
MKIGPNAFQTRLRDLVASGASRAEIDQLAKESGVSEAELKKALDQFDTAPRKDNAAIIGAEPTNPSLKRDPSVTGMRAHDVKVRAKPWFANVKSELPGALYPEPARDVTVQGHKFTKDDVLSLLRNVSRS